MHAFVNFEALGKKEAVVVLCSNVLLTHRHRCVTTSFTLESSSLGFKNTCVLETWVAEGRGLWKPKLVSTTPHLDPLSLGFLLCSCGQQTSGEAAMMCRA